MDYPSREQYFAMRFLRLLTKCAAAMEIGPEGVTLLMVIVGQEDACRYTRPVNFWNHQLATLIGLRGGDTEALRRVRERCMRAGWLQYLPGNKQLPARYFVTIPTAVNSLPDGCSDESPQESAEKEPPIQRQFCRESAENLPRICRESAEKRPTSSPNPIPIPGGERAPEPVRESQEPTPPPPESKRKNRDELARTLRRLGLRATEDRPDAPGSINEWSDLMQGLGGSKSASEALEGIAWIVREAKRTGVTVEYAKHARALADQWAKRLERRRQAEADSGDGDAA